MCRNAVGYTHAFADRRAGCLGRLPNRIKPLEWLPRAAGRTMKGPPRSRWPFVLNYVFLVAKVGVEPTRTVKYARF